MNYIEMSIRRREILDRNCPLTPEETQELKGLDDAMDDIINQASDR